MMGLHSPSWDLAIGTHALVGVHGAVSEQSRGTRDRASVIQARHAEAALWRGWLASWVQHA